MREAIFWLLYANEVKAGIAYLFSGERARKVAREVLDEAEKNVSQYFGTLVVINLVLAIVAIGIASAVGLPNPLLWGCACRHTELYSLSRPSDYGSDAVRDWPHDIHDAHRCVGAASFVDHRNHSGGSIPYTHNHRTPPHAESLPCLSVDRLLGMDVGTLGCTSCHPAAHLRRGCAATLSAYPKVPAS